MRSSLLAAAEKAVCGDRDQSYGGPEASFATIGRMWGAYLCVADFDPGDVAAMLALMKLARLGHNGSHWDSWLDLAGYAACGAEVTRPPVPSSVPAATPSGAR